MNCPNCGFENPSGMRFCGQCGTRLPTATSPLPPAGQFSPEQLGVMMGPDLQARFRRAGLEVAGQRRSVTVLFADLAGYTALSERIDPEDLYTLIQDFIRLLAQNVYKYEGAVDKYTGDGLMALFGAPIAHENNAELAVRAACDMQADLDRFSQDVQARFGTAVRLHIGLHTGPVIVGGIGSNLLMNYTAIGDTVNLARRLQEASAPGTILASESVYAQTRALFDFRAVPPLTVKGLLRPVPAYEILGPKDRPSPVRGVEGLRAPMVGREAELRRLRDHAAALAHARHGHFVLLTGEAGLGKSRLVAEFKTHLEGQPLLVLEGHSLTYRRAVPYWIFADMLRSYLGTGPATPEAVVRARLAERAGAALGASAPEALPFLEHVLSLRPATPEAAARVEPLDPAQLRQQVFLIVRELLAAEAQRQPLVLIFDDLHWADEVSLDLLASLADTLRQSRVLVVAVTRPVQEAPLTAAVEQVQRRLGDLFTHIELQSLSRDESQRLLLELVAMPDLPEAVGQEILQRAAGIPFYLEEMLRMLIDAGLLYERQGRWHMAPNADAAALGVPDTLQGLILARFDRLEGAQRRVLQAAAVIGRQFSRAMVTETLRRLDTEAGWDEAAVEAALEPLTRREFVMELPGTAEPEYQFKHALVAEAIYSTLLRRDRAELHGRVGEAIEALFAGREDEQIEVLARHFAWSPRLDRALHYSLRAGQKAMRGYAFEQARRHFEQAIMLLPQVAYTHTQAMEAHMGLGQALLTAGDYDGARDEFEAALEAVAAAGPHASARLARDRSRIQRLLSRTYERQGNHDNAIEGLAAAQAALDEAAEPFPVDRAQILNDLGWIHFRRGDFAVAQRHLNDALALVEGTSAFDVIASIYNRLGGLAYSQGDWTQSASYVRKSIAIRESMADVASLANSFNNLGVLEIEMGQYDSALENLTRSYELQRRQGQADGIAVALNNLGLLRIRRGELPEARAALDEALAIARQIGYSSLLGSVLKHRGELHVAAQEWEAARAALLEGLDLLRELGVQDQLIEVYQLLGEVAFEARDVAEGEMWFRRASAVCAGDDGKRPKLSDIQQGEFLRFRARVAIEQADWPAAQKALRESEAVFALVGNRLYLGRVARDLGLLAARQGELRRAQLHYREATLLFRSVGARLEARHAEAQLTATTQG